VKPRVLVVDDSAFARRLLSTVLRDSGVIDVVGTACDGEDALEQIARLDPDVITLDLTMPVVDGLGVLRALDGRPRPRAIVVSISSIDSDLGAEALVRGAIDLVTKPTALASDRLAGIADELIAKVVAAAAPRASEQVIAPARRPELRAELVMIGASTGGPQALTRVLAALPASLPVPVAIVLHIPIGYTAGLAARLDRASPLDVVEATDHLALRPGLAVLARGGVHLRIRRDELGLHTQLGVSPHRPFTPSVDELFASGAAVAGKRTLGVVLTGMGDDGLVGARLISASGGGLLTEAASSCVVYGMPRSVYEAGLGAVALPLERIAEEIVNRV